MPSELTMGHARSLTFAELERRWEEDFSQLCTTVLAEATGPVDPSVEAALRSAAWASRWDDALYACIGALASAAERKAFTEDPSWKRTLNHLSAVRRRAAEAKELLDRQRRPRAQPRLADARLLVSSVLAKHYAQEFEELRVEEFARRGLPPQEDDERGPGRDGLGRVEDLVASGVLEEPADAQVDRLLGASPQALTRTVALDANEREYCPALRHPLLLRGWAAALERLRDEHYALDGMQPSFTVTLPALDLDALRAMEPAQAWKVLHRRRFLRSLAQRWRECQMEIHWQVQRAELHHQQQRQPRTAALDAAGEALGRRHAVERDALLERCAPFCEEGTMLLQERLHSPRPRGEFRRELAQALREHNSGREPAVPTKA